MYAPGTQPKCLFICASVKKIASSIALHQRVTTSSFRLALSIAGEPHQALTEGASKLAQKSYHNRRFF
jgi:hypothetical protein